MNDFRNDFPFFSNEKNKGLIYFDNAATTQRPHQVIDAIRHFYEENNANPLRGLYDLSVRATEAYENARHSVARFINAAEDCEVIFTRNASESLNLIAYTYGMTNIREGDEIAVSIMEHHSNILPWQMVTKAKGAKLVYLECDRESGVISDEEIAAKIGSRTKIVAVAHVSNVLGITNDIEKIAKAAHKAGAVVVVDGAQAVPHIKTDVRSLDADFYAFSAHKLTGPTGCGVLYGKKSLLENMPPFLRGGEMIEYVTREEATWAPLPAKFEAGTVNAGGAVALEAAVKYIESIGFDHITKHDNSLASRLIEGMKKIPHVSVIGNPDGNRHCGIVTFTIDGVHPHDIATVLDTERIAIRAGHHCAQPLGSYLGVPATARASVYFYNTEEEVDVFLSKVKNIRSWMGFKD
ncbi:aminotransferase class V-fold PLP-dependent enzyme [Treponema sp. Marseille-Q4523]|uniref:aminotransferase class V-fold PLP-dependent enzyme n=1 Tax=Treponema sp. Marseille-Q4523 TaxID=2810610 RepID=UPI00195F3CD0|nr:SufS family cysteine desulfurase [Treponema sp. Marseille-Q4523]MBM7023793.1 SufS family cysteine desulfurase [Treponema sp. Marseille-Q4523]